VDSTRSALIVASDQYSDPGLRRLRAPASDAQALEAVLRDPGIGGFQVRTLLNEPAHKVNLAVEEFFADRQLDDLLLLHFSCHGVKDEGGELYFATSNTILRRLGATAVAAEFVNRRMSRSRSRRVVLLLDCCYAGAFERGMTARAGTEVGIEAQFGGRGRAVITASSAMEYAFEGDELADARELAPSVFTSALVEGLDTGEADRDQDGLVALDELYDYVYDKVRATTPNQTPGKWMFGVQGDLYIARRARPVTTPAPLPPELQQAIDSPFAAVRAGAVQELARLLQGRHAGLALAAKLTLERLTNDDSRTVAAAATAALGVQAKPAPPQLAPPQLAAPQLAAPQLALSAAVVDFGRLPQRGQSPERTVRLGNAGGGILNARVATRPSWLKLRQVGDDLVVAVDTTEVGDHEDTVTIDSDGGSATLRVLARVDPMPLPASGTAVTTSPEAEPEPPKGAGPGAQQDVAVAKAAPTPAPTPTVSTGEVVAGSAAEPALTPTGVDRRPLDSQARDDGRLRVVGGLAIVGAALIFVGLFPAYVGGVRLASDSDTWRASDNIWYAVIVAALALGAGIRSFAPRTTRLVGPGLLLGTVAASTWVLLIIVVGSLTYDFSVGAGFLLFLIGHLLLVLAGCLAWRAVAQAGAVRLVSRPPKGALPRLVVLLGVVGAVALISAFVTQRSDPGHQVALIWAIAMALVVPACAAVAVRRQFGVALLGAWIGAAGALWPSFQTDYMGGVGVALFGYTLPALLLVIIPFARTSPTSRVERTPRGGPSAGRPT
jgi:hypothetical protein